MAEFALNNATHASTGLTPFFVNNARHPRVPALLAVRSSNPPAVSTLGGVGRAPTPQSVQSSSDPPQSDEPHQETAAEVHVVEGHALHGVAYERLAAVDAAMPAASTVANFAPKPAPTPIDSAVVSELLLQRQAVTRDRVLLSTDRNQGSAVTNLGANKLAPRFIGPFKILNVIGDAYTLDIPTSMRLHPTFYVGRLKPYVPATIPAPAADRLQSTRPQSPHPEPARSPGVSADDADAASARALAPHARALSSEVPRRQDSPYDEAAPSSHAVPAPTGPRQLQQPRHAGAKTRRGSELPLLHPSLGPSSSSLADQSPELSADAAGSPGATSRQSSKPTKPMKPATLQSPRSEATIRPTEISVSAKPTKPATLQSRGSEATLPPTETTFRRDGPPPLVDASGARCWIAERIGDHETRRPRAMDSVATSRRTTETYYRVRWLGFPHAEDTWEPRERLMEDIPDFVKEYEATLALVFDAGSLEHNHDLLSVIPQAALTGKTASSRFAKLVEAHRAADATSAAASGVAEDVPEKTVLLDELLALLDDHAVKASTKKAADQLKRARDEEASLAAPRLAMKTLRENAEDGSPVKKKKEAELNESLVSLKEKELAAQKVTREFKAAERACERREDHEEAALVHREANEYMLNLARVIRKSI
ncbi:unnamed protein product [Phytophthora fragariaefolia]|uniref:Unnamed protein product n=1 Tax=Phytophthora fragariaefolia TaxID=1490495 RepID=A0A9W6XTN6_9STRA|nr:unnamed protein product [Phytophthora fragariaefolia]